MSCCLWAMTMDNIFPWLLTFQMKTGIFASVVNSKDFKGVCYIRKIWIKLQRHSHSILLVSIKATAFYSHFRMKRMFKEFSNRKLKLFVSESTLKTFFSRRFKLDHSSQIIAKLCAWNPAQCSSWKGSLHSTQNPNPTYLQMSSIKPYILRIVYSNAPNRASFTFFWTFSSNCLLARLKQFNLFDCFPFSSKLSALFMMSIRPYHASINENAFT